MCAFIPHARPCATPGDIAAVVRALESGHFAQGQEVAALEDELCAKFGIRHAVVVSSGTSALLLSLMALGVGRGDSVCIPSYSCPCPYHAVSYTGATALCIDCEKGSVCMAPDFSGSKPSAAIVPHMFGYEANVQFWKAGGVPVIEDCAQSPGGKAADGAMLGTRGNIAILSFYATKLIPAGEGGACLTNDDKLACRIRSLRNCDEQSLLPGAFNFKMTDVCAALARSKLQDLDVSLERREQIAMRYDEAFGPLSFRQASGQRQAVSFRYLIQVAPSKHAAVLARANAEGIGCRQPVWQPLHRQLQIDCPEADRWHASLISVPLYPTLTDVEIERICHELPAIIHSI